MIAVIIRDLDDIGLSENKKVNIKKLKGINKENSIFNINTNSLLKNISKFDKLFVTLYISIVMNGTIYVIDIIKIKLIAITILKFFIIFL